MEIIKGNVTAPLGFKGSGINCGIRKSKTKSDLGLICCDKVCNAAAVYTTNKVKGAPLVLTKEHLANGKAQAVICNSGNANTCNEDGYEIADKTAKALSCKLGISDDDVIVASTGVIGKKLDVNLIINGMPSLIENLSYEGGVNVASAILTTDTKMKEIAVEEIIDGKNVKIGAVAKGSGMINPNMATMLCFITTDCAISSEMLQKALSASVKDTFNMVSVDGDTSTNDMVTVLASGMAGNAEITYENDDYIKFLNALNFINTEMAKKIAADGEGATKLIIADVKGAESKESARIIAKKIISSSLVKAAMFGADANWGRILCAIGYSGENVDPSKIDVSFKSQKGEILVCRNGGGVDFSEEKAKEILLCDEITIDVSLGMGEFDAVSYGCDLTYEYVKINGDYRT